MDLKNQENSQITIAFIGNIVKPNEAKSFIKREIGLQITEEINGNPYSRKIQMQAVGDTEKPQFDKTRLLDGFKVGDIVDIKYTISGSFKSDEKIEKTITNPEGLTGFNNIGLIDIKHYQSQVYSSQNTQPVNVGTYQQQPNYQPTDPINTQSSRIPQPNGAIPKSENGMDQVWNDRTGGWEDLPF